MDLKLITFPNDCLITPCSEITEITDEIRELTRAMIRMMYEWKGIGLAAPQVGFNVKLCVIDPMATLNDFMSPPIIMINPEISGLKKEIELEEGCLSHSDEKYRTKRYQMCNVRYQQLDGKWILVPAKGLFAICSQHEIDHLGGRTIRTQFSPVEEKQEIEENAI